MHINVRDILVESVGYNRTYTISGERPELDGVTLTADINGEIQISRLDACLLVTGQLGTEIELECHRCLRTFTRFMRFSLHQEFSETPEDDQMPITDKGSLDLAPVIGQEIILGIPIKVLCRPDCPGIEGATDLYTKEEPSLRIKDRANITKGTKRGRT